VNWGVTNANAVTVATLPGNRDRATIFAYDEASTLINSDVPGNTTSATLLGQFTFTISTDPGILKLGETELSVKGAGFVTLEFLRTDGSAGTIDPSANGELTAGLSGSTTVFSTASEFAWGDPNDQAFTIATLSSDGNQAGIFAYDKGARHPLGDEK
jgi:hypothetical protein